MTTVAFQYGSETWDWRPMQNVSEVPMPGPSASRRAQAFAMTAMYQRAFAAAVLGDTASASKAAARFRATVDPVGANVPTSSAIRAREIEAMIAKKRGDPDRAIQLLQEASAIEDTFLRRPADHARRARAPRRRARRRQAAGRGAGSV